MTNQGAAQELGVSIETIKSNVKASILCLGARNRTHAVAIALRSGYIKNPNAYTCDP